VHREAAPAQQRRDQGVAGAGVPWPDAGGHRDPAADGQVGGAAGDGVGHRRQHRRVQRAVAVEHGDQVGGRGAQSGVDGGAVAAAGFGDDVRAVGAGDRGSCIGGAVVDDQDGPPRGKGGERGGQCVGLVEARQDDEWGVVHVVILGPRVAGWWPRALTEW
jgi:hypothetical protein